MSLIPASLHSIPVPRRGAGGHWTGRLTLRSGERDASFDATEELLGYFARLCCTGALAVDEGHASDSRLEFAVVARGQSLEVVLSARHLHSGSWRILMQMLAHCHAMEPFDSIALTDESTDTSANLPPPDDTPALLQPYPPVFDGFPQASAMLDTLSSESLTLGVACQRTISSEELGSLSSLVDDWGSVVFVGGFTPASMGIAQALLDKPRIVRQGWTAFDIAIAYWSPNADALAVLLNLMLLLKDRLSIDSVELG